MNNNTQRNLVSQRDNSLNRRVLILMREIFRIKKNLEKLNIKNPEQWELIKIDFMSRISNANANSEE